MLEPLTVLVGPNASGKTILLEGLSLVSTAGVAMGLANAGITRPLSMQSFGASSPVELSISGSWHGIEGRIQIIGTKIKSGDTSDEDLFFSATGEWKELSITGVA
jgi:recombinational DNA repair ATPase RecF